MNGFPSGIHGGSAQELIRGKAEYFKGRGIEVNDTALVILEDKSCHE